MNRWVPGFTGSTLDRADLVRTNPEQLAALTGSLSARLLVLDGIDPVLDQDGLMVWKSLAEADPSSELIFLGFDDGKPRFAEVRPDLPRGASRSPAIFRMLDIMPPGEAGTYAAARSLIDWHLRHGFCAQCGTRTEMFRGGWGRKCGQCKAEHFPRVDPVVIMLAEHDGKVLIGRQPAYPPRRYSALAGFLEPGESLEEAVARELHEEAGLRASNVRYVVSQPWPFPSSLMMACIADADRDELTIDYTELEDAIWVTREEVQASLDGDPDAPFLPPPPYAIAHTLFRRWLEGGG
ncbi:NAD(+) diphosphatase [Sphingomonas cavernae]|uniref:NAD(+) diphosphatase n=1 Tax=Sphingomonas cavernae TaxID=2320861 RepID=A0A418WKD4_9SPHN|nr:NAD(+) diphosphatase [Sphingomonas cavernae]RJF90511.1 NAD(+) diphosphatase [Sphingomonas cavernae]